MAKRTSGTANSNKNSSLLFDAFISSIKNKTQIAVINIVSFRIFMNLKMRKFTMFITAVCVLFLIKLRWAGPRTKASLFIFRRSRNWKSGKIRNIIKNIDYQFEFFSGHGQPFGHKTRRIIFWIHDSRKIKTGNHKAHKGNWTVQKYNFIL